MSRYRRQEIESLWEPLPAPPRRERHSAAYRRSVSRLRDAELFLRRLTVRCVQEDGRLTIIGRARLALVFELLEPFAHGRTRPGEGPGRGGEGLDDLEG